MGILFAKPARWRFGCAVAQAFPQRRRPVHFPTIEAAGRSTIVLLTVCTHQRRPLLAAADVVELLTTSWREATAWLTGRYVILPDHLHLFCTPNGRDTVPIARWVAYWKSMVSRRWPRPNGLPVWQQGFWDRQLRSSDNYHERWEYVRNNPVRHGLVDSAGAWPWQGELNAFRYRDVI